jgi:hypothetical protein
LEKIIFVLTIYTALNKDSISLLIYDFYDDSTKGKNKFKISGLKKGVYFIEVNFNEKLKKFKVIKI